MTWVEVVVAGLLLVGALVQRVAGLGIGLVCVPPLVMLLGPLDGVSLSNSASSVLSAFSLLAVWREVQVRTMLPLAAAAACTVPAGAWVAHHLPAPLLLTGMGAAVTVAVLLVIRGARVSALHGRKGAVTAGAVSGFMNATAGVGGPAVSLWALNAGWTAKQFLPNSLFFLFLVNGLSVLTKGPPRLAAPAWLLAGAGVAIGGLIGRRLEKRIPEAPARRLLLMLALAGGLATLGKGLAGLG
ncbi:TSUP family transporter [Streptomyces boninensis]|uniref:TSUP family transporter n=1 Tax=Streptomyces boninensis TaxID=2039455 RepID=UPI003B212E8C